MFKLKNAIERRYFSSLTAFVEYCDGAPCNFDDDYRASEKTEGDGGKFYGTPDYETASRFVRRGWEQGAERLDLARKTAVSAGRNSYSAPVPHLDVCGGAPIVAEWLGGNPECMLNESDPLELPVVTIAVHIGALCDVDARLMVNRGVAVLVAAHEIEQAGSTVQILAYSGQYSTHGERGKEARWGDCMIQIKAPDQPFDVHVLAYALANPSMFRRHCFRVIEGFPKPYAQDFRYGYGRQVCLLQVEADETAQRVDWYIPTINDQGMRRFDDLMAGVEFIRQAGIKAGVLMPD